MASAQPPGEDPGDFIKQGQALARQGKSDDALEMYRHALQLTPDSFPANSAAGVAADLKGDYAAARQYFAKAIQAAPSNANKIRALRDMAISYGFEGACQEAVKYDRQAYDMEIAAKDFYNAGEVADELARLCIDAGDLDTASQWYKTGHDAGLREPGIEADRVNLWEFRWEHAQARLAARRGDQAGAEKHVAAARAVLAKGDNPQQQQFLPYLTGYVAFYAGDYKTAVAEFQKGNLNDAFVVSMIAQAYEKLGDRDKAMDRYQAALGFISHNPPVAYARPLARKKLAGARHEITTPTAP
jgi:tetratricopeptide (TPR) repeat protein